MPKSKKQRYEKNDCFAIRLADFTYSIGQVLSLEPDAMDSVVCAFFARQLQELPQRQSDFDLSDKIIAVLFVSRDYLDSGEWQIIGRGKPIDPNNFIPLDEQRRKGFVGSTIIGAGIAKVLMDAYYRLYPWNGFAIPNYLDDLLLSPELKPRDVLYR